MSLLPRLDNAIDLGAANPNQVIHITLGLQVPKIAELEAFADSVSDPHSFNYGRFITPEEVGSRFGLSNEQFGQIANYLEKKGFKISLRSKNRMAILATGTIGQANNAFGTSIHNFKITPVDNVEPAQFYAYSQAVKLPSLIADNVITISGLQNYTRPQRRTTLTPTLTRALYNVKPMFDANYRGDNRTTGVSNWDGFHISDAAQFVTDYGLPHNGAAASNVSVVTISGGAQNGQVHGEGDLDIQMELATAPLASVIVYDGGNGDLLGVLSTEASNNTADCISESWGWNIDAGTANSAHNTHVSMSAQGITYMAASGDSGTSIEPYSYPDYDPEVLLVGGTIATVNGSGIRTSEVGWSGSGGGYSNHSNTWNVRPSWQTGTGVPTNINKRLGPDIALHASSSGGAYYFRALGSLYVGDGTSFASPVFCGSLAVAEQKIIANGGLPANGAGKRRMGRIQNLVYSQNGRADVWYDITSGSNGNLPNGAASSCTAKWDSVTGWGAPDMNAFVAAYAPANNPVPTLVGITPALRTAGASGFTMTLSGTNFVDTSVVRVDGSDRTTTFVSDTSLTASIPASDIANAGTHQITVFNPAPGGGTSNSVTLTVNNPSPTLTSISPTTVQAGSASFTLTLNGTNFKTQSYITVDGQSRSTTFVTANVLNATITAGDLSVSGTHSIRVVNPAPGGGTSVAKTLTVTVGALQVVNPTSFSIIEGSLFSGGLAQLLTSDNNYVAAFPDDVTLACTYQVDGTAPATGTNPTLRFDYEGKTSRPGLTVEVRLKNYSTNNYEVVDSREALLSDDTMSPTKTTAIDYFGSGQAISAQISFYPFNDESPSQDGWLQFVDLARWQIGS